MTRTTYRLRAGKDRHRFSAAHMTVFGDGTKERLHGHNFQIAAVLDLRDIEQGSFVDVAILKCALDELCAAWDQRLLLAERSPHLRVIRHDARDLEFSLCGERYLVPASDALLLPLDNIVVETLAAELATRLVERLRPALPPDVVVAVEVTVAESPGQDATCRLDLP